MWISSLLEEQSLRRYPRISQQSEIPFRLDETNSVSVRGVAGISDTFASALWAGLVPQPRDGDGGRGRSTSRAIRQLRWLQPLCAATAEDLADGQLTAQPEYYALLMLRALIGERPLPSTVSGPAADGLLASAFLAPMVASRGARRRAEAHSRALSVHLDVGSVFSSASVLSLTAPSPSALSGVKLGGRAVQREGT